MEEKPVEGQCQICNKPSTDFVEISRCKVMVGQQILRSVVYCESCLRDTEKYGTMVGLGLLSYNPMPNENGWESEG